MRLAKGKAFLLQHIFCMCCFSCFVYPTNRTGEPTIHLTNLPSFVCIFLNPVLPPCKYIYMHVFIFTSFPARDSKCCKKVKCCMKLLSSSFLSSSCSPHQQKTFRKVQLSKRQEMFFPCSSSTGSIHINKHVTFTFYIIIIIMLLIKLAYQFTRR